MPKQHRTVFAIIVKDQDITVPLYSGEVTTSKSVDTDQSSISLKTVTCGFVSLKLVTSPTYPKRCTNFKYPLRRSARGIVPFSTSLVKSDTRAERHGVTGVRNLTF